MVNGSACRLPAGPFNRALATSRLLFGTEAIEYRSPTSDPSRRDAGHQGVPDAKRGRHVRPAAVGAVLVRTLPSPSPFSPRPTGQSLLQRQFNRMANAGDFAVSQAAELKDALDALTSNEFVMGDHHFSLQLLADVTFRTRNRRPAVARLKALNDQVALARSLLADTGCWWPARIWRSKPPSGRSCPATFRSDRARHRSPREISPRCRRFTTIRRAARTAITGARP